MAVAGMCACVAGSGIAIAAGAAGELEALEKMAIASICCLIASYVFFRTVRFARVCEIHVSGAGQIRVRILSKNERLAGQGAEYSVNQHGELVRLLPVSTLWPWLLILHLRQENGRNSILTILPDAVSKESFRALLVACKWLTMRRAENS